MTTAISWVPSEYAYCANSKDLLFCSFFKLIVPPYLEGIEENDRPVISGISSQDSFLPGEVVEVTMDSNKPHSFALMRSGPATHGVYSNQF